MRSLAATLLMLASASPALADNAWDAKPRPRVLEVVDAESGKPVAGVEVSAVTPEEETFLSATGDKGLAPVPKPQPGWQFLSVHKAGYRTQLVDVQDVELYFAGPPKTYSKYFDGFAGTVKLEHDE